MRVLIFAVIALIFSDRAFAEEKRLALLIGNSDYPAEVGRLQLPTQDVSQLDEALRSVGFQVDRRLDLDEDGMENALSEFEQRINVEAANGEEVVAFLYYSGHGASAMIQGTRKNYLLPARERITSASELARKGISMDDVITGLSLTRAVSVFVTADACRNDLVSAFDRSADKGFAPIAARPGMFIAHSTYPGQTAPDDGAFARTLAENIRKPGLFAERAFALTNRQVAASRGLNQIPTTAGALNQDFCFNGCPGDQPVAAIPTPSPRLEPQPVVTQPKPAATRGFQVKRGDELHGVPGLWETQTVSTLTTTMGFNSETTGPLTDISQNCETEDDTYFDPLELAEGTDCQLIDDEVQDHTLYATLTCIDPNSGLVVKANAQFIVAPDGRSADGFIYTEANNGLMSLQGNVVMTMRRLGECN